MQGRRNPFVAHEGIPFLLFAGLGCWLAWRYLGLYWFAASLVVFVILLFVFRDPRRSIPASPLGVVSPVDGEVVEVEKVFRGDPLGEVWRVVLRVDALGTYTARCPVEGTIRDPGSIAGGDDEASGFLGNALWVETDEGDEVVLQFRGYRFGLAPMSLSGFGERLGQGSRCAYLRLTRFADVYIPANGQVLVQPGQRVIAGRDLVARLPPP